jgi:hypothetical protein
MSLDDPVSLGQLVRWLWLRSSVVRSIGFPRRPPNRARGVERTLGQLFRFDQFVLKKAATLNRDGKISALVVHDAAHGAVIRSCQRQPVEWDRGESTRWCSQLHFRSARITTKASAASRCGAAAIHRAAGAARVPRSRSSTAAAAVPAKVPAAASPCDNWCRSPPRGRTC